MSLPRVAFFADSFLEVNGVAHTCRTLMGLAQRHESPFLLVHGGPESETEVSGALTRCQLKRGRTSFAVDRDFRYDLLFYRHRAAVERRLRAFAPDVVHITGPGDVGTLGLVLARALHADEQDGPHVTPGLVALALGELLQRFQFAVRGDERVERTDR